MYLIKIFKPETSLTDWGIFSLHSIKKNSLKTKTSRTLVILTLTAFVIYQNFYYQINFKTFSIFRAFFIFLQNFCQFFTSNYEKYFFFLDS